MGRQTGKLPLDNCCSECKLGHKELDTTERLRTHVHMQRGGAFLEADPNLKQIALKPAYKERRFRHLCIPGA